MHKAPIIFIIYGYLAPALLFLPDFFEVPHWLETATIGFVFPLWLLILPWMDLLHSLHLTQGEWFRAPGFVGLALVLLAYCACYYLIVLLLRRLGLIWVKRK